MALVLGNATPTTRINRNSPGPVVPDFIIPSATYWRCRALRWASNTNWELAEMILAATPGGATLLAGGSPISSYTPGMANAFDGNPATVWRNTFAANGWIGYVSPTAISPQELRITSSSTSNQYPVGLTLDYSLDSGATWIVFAVFDDAPWTLGQTRGWSFNPALPNNSIVWRNYVEVNTSGNNLAIDIAEINLAATVGGPNLLTGGAPTGNADTITYVITLAFDNNPATFARWTNQFRSVADYTRASATPGKELRVQGSPIAGLNNPGDLRLCLPDTTTGAWRVAAAATGYSAWTAGEIKSVVVP